MNSMPFRQLKSFLKILIGVQYEIENVTIQQNPVLKKRRIFCINVTSSQKNALSCGMIKPQSRKRWRTRKSSAIPIRRLSIPSGKDSSAPAGTVPAAGSAQRRPNVCVRSFRIKLQIRTSRDSATVCSITNPCRIKGGTLCCQRNWPP